MYGGKEMNVWTINNAWPEIKLQHAGQLPSLSFTKHRPFILKAINTTAAK